MSFRCRTTKPSAALWLLIAAADAALLLAGVGLTGTLVLLGSVATAALTAVAVRVVARRTQPSVARTRSPIPAPLPARTPHRVR